MNREADDSRTIGEALEPKKYHQEFFHETINNVRVRGAQWSRVLENRDEIS